MERVLDHICRLPTDDVTAVLNSTLSASRGWRMERNECVNGRKEFGLMFDVTGADELSTGIAWGTFYFELKLQMLGSVSLDCIYI